MHRNIMLPLLLASALAFGARAVAGDSDDLDALRKAQAALQAEITAGRGAYRDLPPARRDALLQDQAQLLDLIEGRASLGELAPAERSAVQALVGRIATAQRQAEDDRVICRREKRSGTHVASNVCRTVGERRRDREAARSFGERPAQCTEGHLCAGL